MKASGIILSFSVWIAPLHEETYITAGYNVYIYTYLLSGFLTRWTISSIGVLFIIFCKDRAGNPDLYFFLTPKTDCKLLKQTLLMCRIKTYRYLCTLKVVPLLNTVWPNCNFSKHC